MNAASALAALDGTLPCGTALHDYAERDELFTHLNVGDVEHFAMDVQAKLLPLLDGEAHKDVFLRAYSLAAKLTSRLHGNRAPNKLDRFEAETEVTVKNIEQRRRAFHTQLLLFRYMLELLLVFRKVDSNFNERVSQAECLSAFRFLQAWNVNEVDIRHRFGQHGRAPLELPFGEFAEWCATRRLLLLATIEGSDEDCEPTGAFSKGHLRWLSKAASKLTWKPAVVEAVTKLAGGPHFSFGRTASEPKKLNAGPGIGSYEAPRSTLVRGSSFGTGRRFPADAEAPWRKKPGPGDYNPKPTQRTRSCGFGGAARGCPNPIRASGPGPGAYLSQSRTIGDGPSYTARGLIPRSYGEGEAAPGPTTYNLPAWLPHQRTPVKVGFGTSVRGRMFMGETDPGPGPGAFELQKYHTIGTSAKKFSIISRRRDYDLTGYSLPGPSDYNNAFSSFPSES